MNSLFKKAISRTSLATFTKRSPLCRFIGEDKFSKYSKRQHDDEVEIIDKDNLLQIGGEEPPKVGKTYEEYVLEQKEFQEKEHAISQDILDSQIKDDKTPY